MILYAASDIALPNPVTKALALCCQLMSSDDEKIRFVFGTSGNMEAI